MKAYETLACVDKVRSQRKQLQRDRSLEEITDVSVVK